MSASYQEKLKDPRWKEKRNQVIKRDKFKCTCCGSVNNLEVHHLAYHAKYDPWEYNISDLITFCHKCHKYEHSLLTLARVGIYLSDYSGIEV